MRSYLWCVCAGLGFCVGCTDRAGEVTRELRIVDREALGGSVVYIERNNAEAFAVDVTGASLRPRAERFALPSQPSSAIRRTGKDELLVPCDGKRNDYGDVEEAPSLAVVSKDYDVRTYKLSASAGSLVQSSDGTLALLWGVAVAGSELLSDPNRVSLVSLEDAPSDQNPFGKTLPAPGGQVTGAFITEPIVINKVRRRLGIFQSAGGLTLWDLSQPSHSPITIELGGSSSTVQIAKIVADDEAGQLYLLIAGSSDIHVLSFLPASDSRDNDFWPSLNQLQLGSGPASDMLLMPGEEEQRVLAAVGSSVAVVRASENVVTAIAVGTPVQNLLPFDGTSPNDEEVSQRVLGWSPGSSVVAFVDLYELEQLGTRNVELLSLGHSLSGVMDLGGHRVLASFSDAAIGIIDLESRRFTPLSTSATLNSPVIDPEGGRVWVAPPDDSKLGYFATDTLDFGEVRLDANIQEFFVLGGTKRRVAVTHDSSVGSITVLDASNPSRKTAVGLEGFLVDGVVE